VPNAAVEGPFTPGVLTKNQEYLESEHLSNESVANLTECICSSLPRMHV